MEIIDLLVRARLCGLEGLGQFCEHHTFAPACWHCRMRGGKKKMRECGKEREWPRVAIRKGTLACSRYGGPCAFLQPASTHKGRKAPMQSALYSPPCLSPQRTSVIQINNTRLFQFPKRPCLVPSPTALVLEWVSWPSCSAQTLAGHRVSYCPHPRFGRDSLASYAENTPLASSASPTSWVTSRF